MVCAQPIIHLGEWDAQSSRRFLRYKRTTWMSESQQRKRTCQIVDFAIQMDYRVKIKESRKRDRFLDLARELKSYGTWR